MSPTAQPHHYRSQAAQAGTRHHLESVALELKQACARLQEERAQLQTQQLLLTGLAELMGVYRSTLQEGNELLSFLNTTCLEELLLDQLTARIPNMTLNSNSSDARSSADSNSSVSRGAAFEQDDADDSVSSAAVAGACLSSRAEAQYLQNATQQHSQEADCPMASVCMVPDVIMQDASAVQDSCLLSLQDSCLLSLQDPVLAAVQQEETNYQLWQLQQLVQPVSPDHDPFLLPRAIFGGDFDERAHTMTLQQLKDLWLDDVVYLRECLQELQLVLQRGGQIIAPRLADATGQPAVAAGSARSSMPQSAEEWKQQQRINPLVAIRDRMMSMYHLVLSLTAVKKDNLYFDLQLENWKTGKRMQEPCCERHRAALQELQLTPAQQQRMAAGWKFFQMLVAPLVAERKQLHAQGLPVEGLQPTEGAPNGRATPSGVGPGVEVSAAHSGQGAALQAQREQLARLRLLSGKDTMLRGMMCSYIQGCMSWVQQAKLRILLSPYHINMGIFCVVLMEQMRDQQLQQQPLTSHLTCKPVTPPAAATAVGAAAAAAGNTSVSM